MDSITVTIAVYEHIEFGYKTVFQKNTAQVVELEGRHVRVSEWMTVDLPALPGDSTAAKVAALDSKAHEIRKELASLDAARARLRPSNDVLDVVEPDPYLHSDIDQETLQDAADHARKSAVEERLLGGAA